MLLKLENKSVLATIRGPDPSWQHGGSSMLFPVRNTVVLQGCDAVGRAVGKGI